MCASVFVKYAFGMLKSGLHNFTLEKEFDCVMSILEFSMRRFALLRISTKTTPQFKPLKVYSTTLSLLLGE